MLNNIRFFVSLGLQWVRASALGCCRPEGSRTLIIPCDPWGVVGSRGDQAMILSVLQHCRERQIDILTDSPATDAACRELKMNPLPQWNVPFDKWMRENAARYSQVFILGADVTDGVYGWVTAMKLLMFYDCFSRLGVETHYLGFSWSKTPSPWMHLVLPFLKKGLPLPVRDPVSLERLTHFTRHRPLVQVADAAFCLHPRVSKRVLRYQSWVGAQKSAGKRVVAVNVHTMFNEAETKSVDWERAFAEVLFKVQAAKPDVVWLFVPHDNRPASSDLAILSRLHRSFDSTHACLVDEVMNADEIKALVGSCDGLIAGRMHISIAALGMGVPVFGLVYQGKFEGLWRHFGLSSSTIIQPKTILEGVAGVAVKVCQFVDDLFALKSAVQLALSRVILLAEKNFKESNES